LSGGVSVFFFSLYLRKVFYGSLVKCCLSFLHGKCFVKHYIFYVYLSLIF